MSEWKKIETAPIDGTPILLWLSEDMDRYYVSDGKAPRICIGFCGDADPDFPRRKKLWLSVEAKEEMWGMGSEFTGPMMETNCIEVKPSHWMPLPAPPKDPA